MEGTMSKRSEWDEAVVAYRKRHRVGRRKCRKKACAGMTTVEYQSSQRAMIAEWAWEVRVCPECGEVLTTLVDLLE